MTERRMFVGHRSTAEAEAFVGLSRELTVDVQKNSVHLHDGVTPGGHELANADMSNVDVKILETKLSSKEDKVNKVQTIDEYSSQTEYPSAKAVFDKFEEQQAKIDDKISYNSAVNFVKKAPKPAVVSMVGDSVKIAKNSSVYTTLGGAHSLSQDKQISLVQSSIGNALLFIKKADDVPFLCAVGDNKLTYTDSKVQYDGVGELYLPIALVQRGPSGQCRVVEQFTTLGFVANTLFRYSGLTLVKPNGYDDDGNRLGVEIETTSINVYSVSGTTNGYLDLFHTATTIQAGKFEYNYSMNQNLGSNGTIADGAIAGSIKLLNGKIVGISVPQILLNVDQSSALDLVKRSARSLAPDYAKRYKIAQSGTIVEDGWLQFRFTWKGQSGSINGVQVANCVSDPDGTNTQDPMYLVLAGDTYNMSIDNAYFIPFRS